MNNDFLRSLVAPNPETQLGYCEQFKIPWCEQRPREFFVINPLKNLERRTLSNVAEYRNILLEFDQGTLEEQYSLLGKAGIPYSTLTFSGSKSLHALICLDQAISEKEYYALVEAIYQIVPRLDPACKNANRLSRTPGAVRSENGVTQELLGGTLMSIKLTELLDWFKGNKKRNKILTEELAKEYSPPVEPMVGLEEYESPTLSYTAVRLLEHGETAPGRSRHEALTNLAAELSIKAYSETDIEALLYKAQEAVGLERNDVPGLMNWLRTKRERRR